MDVDFNKIKALVEERDKLIEEHPELRDVQDTIDKALSKAGHKHNRLVIAHNMMMESLRELTAALQKLQ